MIHCEATKWKAILQRILDTTLFLISRGLALQGETTQIGDFHIGNFLRIMELIGKYDDVTREHLAKVKENQLKDQSMRGQAHYLSWYSQNEFISLCGEKLLKTILNQRGRGNFYILIDDATLNISHQEQNFFNQDYLKKNEFAIFSPFRAHSLNRVVVNAAKLNHDVLTFFGNIEHFY
ncbi:hypothetical protein PR048_001148 [Dryococelus australis]|uniref:Uncharacterized protein n=1 Tax=Dryococelus australis TaxID=614101 RepID=A0ABQ9II12_9NEOP|nr:hypothetical protein PR048_001148 [Dryococelus australis]